MLISVIIPCYNSFQFVERAIMSVINQSYHNWELILVDNNSSDDTFSLLEKIQMIYPDKIKVFKEFKKGAPAARNKGLENAKGDWIQFLDADDVLSLTKFQNQIELLNNSDSDFVVAGYKRIINVIGFNLGVVKTPIKDDPWAALIQGRLGITSANLFKKTSLLAVNGWDESLSSSQEANLMFRILKNNGKIAYDPNLFSAFIYFEGDSITRVKNIEKQIKNTRNYIVLRDNIKDFLLSKNELTDRLNLSINFTIYKYLIDKNSDISNAFRDRMDEIKHSLSRISLIKIKLQSFLKKLIL